MILNIDLEQVQIEDYYVMYGAWNRKENQESIEWILDNIRKESIRIKIIGGGLSEVLKNKIKNHTNIEYIGFVDNPYFEIAKSKGLLAPLFNGAGVKVKTIESLALGTPVIGTDITFEGIDNITFDGRSAFINISNTPFKQAIDQLNRINSNDKKTIRENFIGIYNSEKFIDRLK